MTMRRRELLGAGISLPLLACAARGGAGEVPMKTEVAKPTAPSRKLQSFGVILGSVSAALAQDARATMTELAQLGYRELEFGGPPAGMERDEWKALIAELGMKPVAGGTSMHALQTQLDQQIEAAQFFGRPYLVCYYPWPTGKNDRGLDGFKWLADELNRIGAKVKESGLKLAYHNHDLEFATIDGKVPYDIVLAGTDPELVTMELDIYWIHKGNQDAADYIKRYPGRFSLFHVKDMDRGPARSRVCVGDGQLDFARILSTLADQGGEHHFFWEREDKLDGAAQRACARTSARHLLALRF